MSARQLEFLCWVAGWPGDQRHERRARAGAHYPAAAAIPSFGAGQRMAAFHANCAGVVALDAAGPGHCDVCGAGNLGQSELRTRVLRPRQLAVPCWVVECCSCGEFLSADGPEPLHFEGWPHLEVWADGAGWTVRPGGRAACADCADGPGDSAGEAASTWADCRVAVDLDPAYAATVPAFTGGGDAVRDTVPGYLDIRPLPGGDTVELTVGGTNVRARMDITELVRAAGLAAGAAGSRR